MKRAATNILLLLPFTATVAQAQALELRGYYLNVPLWSDSTPFAIGGLGDYQRLRLMTQPFLGHFGLEVAYEHVLTYSQRAVSAPVGALLAGVSPGGREPLGLDWKIEESSHWLWRHRFDRLNVKYAPSDPFEITIGRQPISWATTLLFTPADPFAPFDPADPFREYRGGIDAVRIQIFPDPLTDFDLVFRPSESSTAAATTLLARGRTVWRNWELSAWAGMIHEEPGAAFGASGGVGRVALRGEASLRERNEDKRLAVRATVGADTRLTALDRDLYLVLEYQHDGFAAASSDDIGRLISSDPFSRGELQTLGRDEIAAQASYQAHPLLGLSLLLLSNLRDGSALIAPGAYYSASNEITLQLGLFLGIGDGEPGPTPFSIPSEYGIVPTVLYVSLNAFF